jgi:hypothetical protein
LETIFQELDVATSTVAALLVLDLVLNNKRFALEVNGRRERCRDGVVSSFALGYKTFVAVNDRNSGVFDLPFADVTEGLTAHGSFLGGLRGCPSVCPVISKLFEEWSLDRGCLGVIEMSSSIVCEGKVIL